MLCTPTPQVRCDCTVNGCCYDVQASVGTAHADESSPTAQLRMLGAGLDVLATCYKTALRHLGLLQRRRLNRARLQR